MKKYILLFKLFFKILFNMNQQQYKDFTQRQLGPRKGYGLLKKPLESRFQQNQKGKTMMSQKDLFLYMTITAFEEPEEEIKEELFLPFILLFMIYSNEKDIK